MLNACWLLEGFYMIIYNKKNALNWLKTFIVDTFFHAYVIYINCVIFYVYLCIYLLCNDVTREVQTYSNL